MTDLLLDECYSCVIASLALIKSIALEHADGRNGVIEAAVDLSQTCVACIRSYEAGSVLPQTENRLAEASQRLAEVVDKSSLSSPEATACMLACENFIRTYHQVE